MSTGIATVAKKKDSVGGILATLRLSDLALAFYIFTTVVFNEGVLISVISKVALLVITLGECVARRRSPVNGFMVAALLFFGWSVASLNWSTVPEESVSRIKTFLYQLICYGCVSALVINDKRALKVSLITFVLSSIVSAVVVLGVLGITFTDNRSTSGVVSSGQLALTVTFSMMLCLYSWKKTRHSRYLVLFFGLAFALLLTSARRDFIILLIFFILFSSMGSKDIRKRVGLFVVCSLVVVGVVFAVLNVDFLYQFIGRRLESFAQFVIWGGSGDASTTGRARLIEYGMGLFQGAPFTGNGVGTFEALFVTTHGSWQTSADNNYVELLADLGIVGFLLYYIPLAIFLIRNLKGITSASLEKQFAVSGMIAFAAIDFACVWFFSKSGMLIILYFYLMTKPLMPGRDSVSDTAKDCLPLEKGYENE